VVDVVKVGVAVLVGLIDESLEGQKVTIGGTAYPASDIARYAMAIGGFAGSYLLPREFRDIAEAFGLAATPLAVKSVAKAVKAKRYLGGSSAASAAPAPRPVASVTTY